MFEFLRKLRDFEIEDAVQLMSFEARNELVEFLWTTYRKRKDTTFVSCVAWELDKLLPKESAKWYRLQSLLKEIGPPYIPQSESAPIPRKIINVKFPAKNRREYTFAEIRKIVGNAGEHDYYGIIQQMWQSDPITARYAGQLLKETGKIKCRWQKAQIKKMIEIGGVPRTTDPDIGQAL